MGYSVIGTQHNIRVSKCFRISLSAMAMIDDDFGRAVTMSVTKSIQDSIWWMVSGTYNLISCIHSLRSTVLGQISCNLYRILDLHGEGTTTRVALDGISECCVPKFIS
jgi:hypothetical protein